MNIVVFEDRGVPGLEPLSLTRPAFDLWCGGRTLLQRQADATGAAAAGLVVRPTLAALTRLDHPDAAVNDADWFRRAAVAVNARWLPPWTPLADTTTPRVALAGEEV